MADLSLWCGAHASLARAHPLHYSAESRGWGIHGTPVPNPESPSNVNPTARAVPMHGIRGAGGPGMIGAKPP